MKLKRSMVSSFALVAILGLTNIGTINAQGMLEDVSTDIKMECPNNCKKTNPCKPRYRNIFMQSIQELEKDGTLSKDDINKIKEFRRKEKEELRQKMLQEQCKKIDQMVKEKVITKEQATKLKQTIEKNLNNLENQYN